MSYSTKRRGISFGREVHTFVAHCATVIAVAAGALQVTSVPATASILHYTWSANAAFTIDLGTEALSGSFDWDTSTDSVSAMHTTISGAVNSTFTISSMVSFSTPDGWVVFAGPGTTPPLLQVGFLNNLSGAVDDPIVLISASTLHTQYRDAGGGIHLATVATGEALIPEPTTMAVRVGVLAGLGLIRRRRKTRRAT
jgi:hypothetical protein